MSDSGHTDDIRALHREVRILNQRVEDLEGLVAMLTGAESPAEQAPAAAAPPPPARAPEPQPPCAARAAAAAGIDAGAGARAAAQDAAGTAAAAPDRLGQGGRAGVHRAHTGLGRRRGDGARHRAAVRDGRQPRLGDARDEGRPGADRVARPARGRRRARPPRVARRRDPRCRGSGHRRAVRDAVGVDLPLWLLRRGDRLAAGGRDRGAGRRRGHPHPRGAAGGVRPVGGDDRADPDQRRRHRRRRPVLLSDVGRGAAAVPRPSLAMGRRVDRAARVPRGGRAAAGLRRRHRADRVAAGNGRGRAAADGDLVPARTLAAPGATRSAGWAGSPSPHPSRCPPAPRSCSPATAISTATRSPAWRCSWSRLCGPGSPRCRT